VGLKDDLVRGVKMASIASLDSEIEKTRSQVEEMRTKIDKSSKVLDEFAKADTKIGDADFDIENARIDDVLKQQKVMEGNIADLIIGLEDATNVFGSEFESMKSYSAYEKFIGIFSKQKMQRMRSDRVRNMSLAGNLQELLSKSDSIVGILKEQKSVLETRYKTSEASLTEVIERRKRAMEALETTQNRINELNPMLMDIENKISTSTDQKERTDLEADRAKISTEYNEAMAKEQELLAESQTLERYTSMFETFVDSLNNQIAAQNTLINKLTIDTEQRIVLYKALEDSLKTAALKKQWLVSVLPLKSILAICWKCMRKICWQQMTFSAVKSWLMMRLHAVSKR
jgi:peptidoglycan hydrolase CwlO-like protein